MKKPDAARNRSAIELDECHRESIQLLFRASESLSRLARLREENKMSAILIISVIRELSELLKVMSTHEY